MASNKTGMTEGAKQTGGLGGVLIAMIAAGLAGGTILVAGAKVLGELLLSHETERYRRLEEQRELDREEVKRITAAEERFDDADRE